MAVPIHGFVPEAVFTAVAAATVYCLMFRLGLAVPVREHRREWRRPGPLMRGLFASVVAMPLLALAVARAFGLSREAEVGLVLIAIAPGAPGATRRALHAGAAAPFAVALQLAVSVIAVVSMPLWVAALDAVYARTATVDPAEVARQVVLVQWLPLGLGMAVRQWGGDRGARLERPVRRVGAVLLGLLLALLLADVGRMVWESGWRVSVASACIVALALALGHGLGGASADDRTAIAVASATRNVGLALLVASANAAPAVVPAVILDYWAVSAIAIIPYIAWRRRMAGAGRPVSARHQTNLP